MQEAREAGTFFLFYRGEVGGQREDELGPWDEAVQAGCLTRE